MDINRFGYSSSRVTDKEKLLRTVALWAGALGVLQSIIWIGLTIVSILAHFCYIPVPDKLNYGTLIQTIFFDLYFKGDCEPTNAQQYDKTMLSLVSTVLNPTDILIWTCVYLALAVIWLVCSVVLLARVGKQAINTALGATSVWAVVTLLICLMDVALGIIFGIDYDKFNKAAYDFNLSSINAGTPNPMAAILVAAMVTSISLMIISFKGFILWVINFGLLCYLLKIVAYILGDLKGHDTLFMPRKQSDDILSTRPPIDAYEETDNAFSNEAFVPDNRSIGTIELNQESIARAARMSTDTSLQERRFRNLDAFQQYPPPRQTNRKDSIQLEATVITNNVAVTAFPAPDYSPPMPRANSSQSPNGITRNQRY